MAIKTIVLWSAGCLLAGCSKGTLVSDAPKWITYRDNPAHIELQVPPGYTYHNSEPSGAYFGYSANSPFGHFYIEATNSPSGVCRRNLGVSKPTIEEKEGDDVLVWGKVDFRFPPSDPSQEEAKGVPCYPVPPATAAYVLCSENKGRSLLVCISQVTDNPDLAERIFRSFRWTKKAPAGGQGRV